MMRLTLAAPVAAVFAAVLMSGTSAARAGGSDRVYADQHGNLVIESHAGYKRIIVGEGSQAGAVASYIDRQEPGVIYANGIGGNHADSDRDCWRPPVLVKGRPYMYGFDQGVIPLRGGPCE